ncbi:hypothetical protein OpiT1DRAFT_00367 [Opitutaceae bacterium TAV1]|nr:hypothetical protein OpiT1DRAFT_00367 [Opitutaceae bacterium TAV1]
MPRNSDARTGLKMDKTLYLLAQQKAISRRQSFAAYVVDLIALDLIDYPGGEHIPDIQRIRALQKNADGGGAGSKARAS